MAGASNQAAMADMLSQQLLEAAKLVEEQVSSISSNAHTTRFKQLSIMPWLHLQATQADGLYLGLPMM